MIPHNRMTYHFCGIGGSGMSAIAQIMLFQGHHVQGSDRSFDKNQQHPLFQRLEDLGIKLFNQDGSGICGAVNEIIVSTAIENDNPEVNRGVSIRNPCN